MVSAEMLPMPRKRNTEGKMMNATGEALKPIRLDLTAEMHKRLRIQAAKEDKSMAALARELVEEGLKKRGAN
jgi:hypothetical protein